MQDLPRTLKHLTLWLLLVTGGALAVQAWQRQRAADRTQLSADGRSLSLARAPDGHFHWPGTVNGQPVDFLVDTGATGTVLPAALAAGLPREGTVRSQTAGGLVQGHVVRVDLVLHGGLRLQQWPVTVLPELSAPLLGMDVLGRLRFSQADGQLRLSLPGP